MPSKFVTTSLVSAMTLMVGSSQAIAFDRSQTSEIQKIVKSYLEKHPEIIKDSLQKAMENEKLQVAIDRKKAIATSQDQLLMDKDNPVLGNSTGTSTIVAFLDPYCGHCRKFHEPLEKLIQVDPKIKVVIKDLPIFGEQSTIAVQALLAANKQGKYQDFNKALFEFEKPLTKEELIGLADKTGLDMTQFEKDMASEAVKETIIRTRALAEKLQIDGTPAIIVGQEFLPGAADEETLKVLLAKK